MKIQALIAVVLTAALAAVAGGCVKPELPSAKAAASARPIEASASATVKGALPSATPEGLPVWPGAKVVSGGKTTEGAFTLLLTTSDPADKVVGGLNEGFIDAGWTVKGSIEDSSGVALEVSDDQLEGLVTVYPADRGNTIEYLLTPLAN